jgi:hypothetical protein
VIGGFALVLAVVVGIALWMVFEPDGEEQREAYCAALRDVTNDGDLLGALESADSGIAQEFRDIAELAPDAVDGEWETLVSLAEDPASIEEQDAITTAVDAFSALRAIARDAEEECSLDLNIPLE